MNLNPRMGRLILELRQGGVTDPQVLAAIEKLPRSLFLVGPFKGRWDENVALPIGHHQTVSQPLIVGLMTQELEVTDRHKVLEIGTGSGYQAAILAPLCRRLYTVERHPALLKDAENRFKKLKINNITTICGDGTLGWRDQAPFERILVAAAAPDVPPVLFEQLAPNGIMIVPIGLGDDDQILTKVRRTKDGAFTEDLRPTRFVPFVDGIAKI